MFRSNVPPANLPDGWHPIQLKDIASVHGGGRLGLNKSDYVDQGIPAYSAAGQDGFVDVAEGDQPSIILSSIGARCGKSFLAEGPWATLANTQVITPNRAVAEANYLIGLLDNEDYWNRSGSAQPFIKPSDVKGAWVPLPPLDEQRRIAEVLRSVEEALHAARQVAERCEQVLRLELDSIVAKLLADGVAQVKLGEVAKVKGGKRLPKGSEYSDEPTANPYIRVTDWRDYEIRKDDVRFISDDIAQSIWRYTISKSDLFISIAGSVGLVAAVPDELDGAYLTENAAKICINDPSALNATFLVAVLRSRALAEQISWHKGVGGGVPKLALFRIEDLDIPLPPPAVQAEIAHTYTSVRTSAEAARNAADQLQRTRTEVISDLLSGRVRVPS